jgi:LacI family transcriptional regulator
MSSNAPPLVSSPHPTVAVLVDTATGWGRDVIRGILGYAEMHGPWHLTLRASGRSEPHILPTDWRGHGVIARVSTRAMFEALSASGVPVINVSAVQLPDNKFPRVTSDYAAVAEMALDHFLNQGLQQFAYVGPTESSYNKQHRDAFATLCHRSGHTCQIRPTHRRHTGRHGPEHRRADTIEWLHQLLKPIGILTWSTDEGRELLDACHLAGISVPHDVAVLSGDYDDLLCQAASPKLSGLVVPGKQIGHIAAQMLDQQMRGQTLATTEVQLPPVAIVEQPSTDTLAVADADLVEALKYIRAHACDPIQVDDVLEVVATSRRSLERKFADLLGRTPTDEIRRIRLGRARSLLATTDMSISAIADKCGYGTYNYLTRIFRSEYGMSPRTYRQQIQGR